MSFSISHTIIELFTNFELYLYELKLVNNVRTLGEWKLTISSLKFCTRNLKSS